MKRAATDENVIDVTPSIVITPSRYSITIRGLETLMFNRMPMLDKPKSESKAAAKVDPTEREWATWREKLYWDNDGQVIIPGENIHECLKDACKYWGQRIPGEGQKTYTDVIASGAVLEPIYLGVHKDSELILPDGRMCNGNPSKGKKSGAKVFKVRPILRPWGGTFKIHVFDARLNKSILSTIVSYAGMFRGIGEWRPKFGRFELVNIEKLGGEE